MRHGTTCKSAANSASARRLSRTGTATALVRQAEGDFEGALALLDQALELLSRLQEAAEAAGRLGTVNGILVLQALASEAQGDRTQALATLERVLVATEPEGHVQLFLDEGAPMEALLRAADLPRVAPSRVSSLLSAAATGPTGTRSPLQAALLDPLSDRGAGGAQVAGHPDERPRDRP